MGLRNFFQGPVERGTDIEAVVFCRQEPWEALWGRGVGWL